MKLSKKLIIEDGKYLYGFLLITGFLIIMGRTLYAILYPVMYNEDATWTSSLIYDGFIYTCLHAKGSYLVIGNILMLKVALLINTLFFGKNIIHLATILAIISYIFYDLMAFAGVYLLRNILKLKARIILFYGILMMPIGRAISEMYGRASNIGYGVFYIAFVIMLWFFFSEHDTWKKLVNYSIVIMCCVTNPVCYILLAVILVFDFFENIFNNPKSIIVPIIMGGISLVSLGILAMNKVSDIGQVNEEINTAEIIEYFFRSWIYPFVWPFYSNFNDFKAIILMIIFIAICVWFVLVTTQRNRKILIASYLALIGYTLITLISRKSLTWQLDGYSTTWPDRYFYVQNILIVFIFCTFISVIGSLNNENIKNNLKKITSFIFVYTIVILSMNADLIFEFTNSKCVETGKTLEYRIYRAYYEQGEREDYIVLCPFTDTWQMKLPKEYILASIEKNSDDHEPVLQLSNLTDTNWTGGILNDNTTEILFNNTLFNRIKLENAITLYSGEEKYRIISMEIGSEWIHVYVDRDATACAYPSTLTTE